MSLSAREAGLLPERPLSGTVPPDATSTFQRGLRDGYRDAIETWLSFATEVGQLQRKSSQRVYEQMWSALAQWAAQHEIRVDDLTPEALDAYLLARGGESTLSNRYAWRLLRLVDRVLERRAAQHGAARNHAASDALARRPELRMANALKNDSHPDSLSPAEAARLVRLLREVLMPRGAENWLWQDVRNRVSLALMLGAGLAPGEVRALRIEEIVVDGGPRQGLPWQLRLEGNGNARGRETPLAPWAAQLLRHWLVIRTRERIPGVMVFPSTKSTGKPWGKVAQYNAAKRVMTAAKVMAGDGGSFTLRHTFAMRQLRKGVPPDEVAGWLGVSDATGMARYERLLRASPDVNRQVEA